MPGPFRESLHADLTLTAGDQSAHADGGNIKELTLQLSLHGFTGRARIWVDAASGEDGFFALVSSPALLRVTLQVGKALYKVSPAPDPLRLSGVVTARRLREVMSADVSGEPILYRQYDLSFCDGARALWSEHHPCAVYAKKTLAEVLTDNTPAEVSWRGAWPGLSKTRPMLCLALGPDESSFYDFVFWLVHREGGYLWYDYRKQSLVIDAKKPGAGMSRELAFGAIADSTSLEVTFAPPPRAAVHVRNSREGANATLEVEQPNATAGVRHDFLVHTALNAEAEALRGALATRFATGAFDVAAECDAYPEMALAPGDLVTLNAELGSALFAANQALRVIGLKLDAIATDQTPEHDIENTTTEYDVRFALELEAEKDARFRGPGHRAPRYPLRVEGKVLSALGNTGDRAYTIGADPSAGDTYKVSLPLWNATISVPVAPDFMPGHLYFPVYKDSRVWLSLELASARIERFLDWGKDVVVPSASQGNHLLLGKNATSETSIKHWYVDNSPELVIRRVNAADLGTLTVKEGTLTLELTEESSSSGFGATVSVEPQAELAKAEAEQASELALDDLSGSAQAAAAELGASADAAQSSIQAQAQDLRAQIEARARGVDSALAAVGTGIDAQAEAAQQLLGDARAELDELLK